MCSARFYSVLAIEISVRLFFFLHNIFSPIALLLDIRCCDGHFFFADTTGNDWEKCLDLLDLSISALSEVLRSGDIPAGGDILAG